MHVGTELSNFNDSLFQVPCWSLLKLLNSRSMNEVFTLWITFSYLLAFPTELSQIKQCYSGKDPIVMVLKTHDHLIPLSMC